jgi:tRNA(adenine34) deaminase
MDTIDAIDADKHYMQMALREAQRAADAGEVPTGCVIVHTPSNGERPSVIARAHNQVETLKDPTAHAEMIAITQAASAKGDWRLTETVLYVTKEPCAMCAGAIVLARIPRIVFGLADPKRGGAVSVFNIVQHPGLIHRCEVTAGIEEDACRHILQSFFQERRAANQFSGPST